MTHSHHHAEKADLTRNQSLVFDALEDAETPLTAYNILDRLSGEGLRAPLQVYRALDKLLDLGMVHRLESLNAFVACRHPGCDSHEMTAFMICETCGQVSEITDGGLTERLTGLARQSGFRFARSTIELRGTCAGCAPA